MPLLIKYFFYQVMFFMFCGAVALAQTRTTITFAQQDSLSGHDNKYQRRNFTNTVQISAIIIPSVALAYGFVKLDNNVLANLDLEARHEFYSEHPHRQFIVDDYLQFAPGAAVFALNGMGIKGRNSLLDQSGVFLLSNIILNGTTQTVKRITDVTRPDGTPYAFPSGHTAEAFASAEFLRREYGDQSVWYTISGYTAAVTVGILRMYNNRHWFSDVVAGAGLGVLSTQTSYWLYPKMKRIFSNKSKTSALILPTYNEGAIRLEMIKTF
jgi:hypothetical protein